MIRAWRRRGLTEKDVAEKLDVALSSLSEYKLQYPELLDVLKGGLDEGVAEVENAHYKAALGHEGPPIIEEWFDKKDGTLIHKKITPQYEPGNVTAQIFILKNRGGWHDKQEIVGAFAHALYDGHSTEDLETEAAKLGALAGI